MLAFFFMVKGCLTPAESTKISFATSYLDAYIIAILPPYECPKTIGFIIFSLQQNSCTISVTSYRLSGSPISVSPKPGKSIE